MNIQRSAQAYTRALLLGSLTVSSLAVGSLSISGCSSEPVERGIEVQGQRLAVIDMHLHPGDWNQVPPETQAFLASRFPFPLNLIPEVFASSILSAEGILSEMDKAGVSAGLLFAVYAPQTVGIASNELVGEQLAVDPERLYGLASLRVDQWNTDAELELQRLEDAITTYGMVGVKLAHAHMLFRMDDPRYFGIYEVAGRLGAPVYLHTGSSPFPGTSQEPPYTDPAYLETAIAQYPETVFILGHMGYDFENKALGTLDHCLRLAQDYPNVYLEPSALGSVGSDPEGVNLPKVMKAIKDAGLVERTIYGSDGPQSPGFVNTYLERTVTAMTSAGYSVDEMRLVLADNFSRVFQVPVITPGE